MITTERKRTFCSLLIAGAISVGCVADGPVGVPASDPNNAHVLRGGVPGSSDPFFVAWDATYSNDLITTQAWSGPDSRQYRQHVSFVVDGSVLAFAAANPGRLYINGDEPDQVCYSPYYYAGVYHDFVQAILSADPSARVSPAGFAEPNEQCCQGVPGDCFNSMHHVGYAQQFYDTYIARYGVAPRVDEWRFHDFALGSTYYLNLAAWWNRVSNTAAWSVAHGANMVLGSWGFLAWSEPTPDFLTHMREAKALLRADGRINQAVWWSHYNTGYLHYLRNADGTLTPEGEEYARRSLSAVSIDGPTQIQPGATCTWSAIAHGGAAPFTYQWTNDWQPVGNDVFYTGSKSAGSSGSSFRLWVRVTDAVGGQAEHEITVYEDAGAPVCAF